MTDERMLIDSNVLVYAYDRSETKKYASAKGLVKEILNSRNGVLSVQNLAEFYYTITRKIEKPLQIDKAKQIVLDYMEGFEIVSYNGKTIIEAINSQAIYKIAFWDALIAATMEENKISTIATENERDFRKVSWIKVVNPFK